MRLTQEQIECLKTSVNHFEMASTSTFNRMCETIDDFRRENEELRATVSGLKSCLIRTSQAAAMWANRAMDAEDTLAKFKLEEAK